MIVKNIFFFKYVFFAVSVLCFFWVANLAIFLSFHKQKADNFSTSRPNSKQIEGAKLKTFSAEKKIAFLFLVYDKINHETLWETFFQNASDRKRYSIYVHYKIDSKMPFFDKFKLLRCVKTNYADITLVQAHKLLLSKALNNRDNFKFINVSQACVPLKSFDYVYQKLIASEKSYFNLMPSKHIFPRCNNLLLRGYSKEIVKKSSNWFILNRYFAQICTKVPHHDYEDIVSPEEHFFVTTVYLFSNPRELQNLQITDNESAGATTFTNWKGMRYPFPGGYPKNYEIISDKEIQFLIKSKALFGRKFSEGCKNLLENLLPVLCGEI